MVLPLEWMREAKRHPYGLAASADGRQPGCDPSSPVPSHERSVSAPRFRAWLDCRRFHSRSYFTCSGLSRILIESVSGRKSYLDRDLYLGPATATLL